MAYSCDACTKKSKNANEVRKTRFVFGREVPRSGGVAPGLPAEELGLDMCDDCFGLGKPIAKKAFEVALSAILQQTLPQRAAPAEVPPEPEKPEPEKPVETPEPPRVTATEMMEPVQTDKDGLEPSPEE